MKFLNQKKKKKDLIWFWFKNFIRMLLLPDFLQFTSNVLTKEISVGNLDEKIAACLWGAAWKNTIYFVAPRFWANLQ